jgi:hypothetical protein
MDFTLMSHGFHIDFAVIFIDFHGFSMEKAGGTNGTRDPSGKRPGTNGTGGPSSGSAWISMASH